jgi:hypothetical protein
VIGGAAADDAAADNDDAGMGRELLIHDTSCGVAEI